MRDTFIGCWLLIDGISILQKCYRIGCSIRKNYQQQINRRTVTLLYKWVPTSAIEKSICQTRSYGDVNFQNNFETAYKCALQCVAHCTYDDINKHFLGLHICRRKFKTASSRVSCHSGWQKIFFTQLYFLKLPTLALVWNCFLTGGDDDTNCNPVGALIQVSQAAAHANDSMKRIEQFKKLLEVQESIGGSIDLVSPTREVLKEGKIVKISARTGDHQDRYLFLVSEGEHLDSGLYTPVFRVDD